MSLLRSDGLGQGREGQQSAILLANLEAKVAGPPGPSEGTVPRLIPAHQGQQGWFTSDVLKRKKLLLNTKVMQQAVWSLNRGRH